MRDLVRAELLLSLVDLEVIQALVRGDAELLIEVFDRGFVELVRLDEILPPVLLDGVSLEVLLLHRQLLLLHSSFLVRLLVIQLLAEV